MNNLNTQFLKLISSTLIGNKVTFDTKKIDITGLEHLAKRNFCLTFIYNAFVINSITPPPCWKQFSSFVVLDSYRKLQTEAEIISILRNNGIRCCVLKGSSVAMNYITPLSRMMGDIDLLVDECNYEKASLLFVSKTEFENNNHSFHFGFDFKNVRIEIHRSVLENKDKNLQLCEYLSDAINNTETKKCDTFDVPVLNHKFQALSLLSHMIRHFRDNEFVFRMFCDWTCFVNSISGEDWLNDICPALKETNLMMFANALNKVAIVYLGFDFKQKLTQDIDDDFCELLMEEFLKENKIMNNDSIDGNLASLFSKKSIKTKSRLLQPLFVINEIAKQRYKLAKSSIFLPLFWLYIPLRYCFLILVRKRKTLDFDVISSSSKRRQEIYKNLNLEL